MTYNKEDDLLSKEVLLLEEDGIFYAAGNEGNPTNYERIEVR